jgi:hypothetical protein
MGFDVWDVAVAADQIIWSDEDAGLVGARGRSRRNEYGNQYDVEEVPLPHTRNSSSHLS